MRSSIQWPENYLGTEGQLAGMIDHQSMGNRLTKIYTRTGDAGLTGLASGDRVAKFDPRIEASGTVDETNCAIGVVLSEKGIPDDVRTCLRRIQNELFDLGAEFSLPEYRAISADHVERLEAELDAFNSRRLPRCRQLPPRPYSLPPRRKSGLGPCGPHDREPRPAQIFKPPLGSAVRGRKIDRPAAGRGGRVMGARAVTFESERKTVTLPNRTGSSLRAR